jgi:glutamate-1-semialdehyde aminotransferase
MDDIRANFRLDIHGSHTFFGAHPDLITMGKALANGYPISVLLGTDGLRETASSFFITGTYWMSAVPMIAAMADRGVFMHPHHNWFMSLAHTEEDIARTLEAARSAFGELRLFSSSERF